MKTHLLLIAVVLLVLSSACVVSDTTTPIIEFGKTTIDFGKALHGQKLDILFPFKNTGAAELDITEVVATCGCTSSTVTKNKLQPGESAEVKVVFDSKNYVGKIRKSIYINSNDPANPSVRLHITGEIQSIVQISPPSLDLGDLKIGTAVERTITITPKIQKKFKILRITSTGKKVTVRKFDKQPGKKGIYCATIKTSAGKTPGRLMEYLNIQTDLPGVPPIRFMVYGNIVKETGPIIAP